MIKKILLLLCLLSPCAYLTAMDGDLDTTFNNPDGFVVDADASTANAVAVQTDGKIVITNSSNITFNNQLVRYNSDGTLDASFGIGGKIEIPLVFFTTFLIQPDGKIVVGGGDGSNFILVRLNSDGTPDTSFGISGFAVGPEGSINAITLETDNRIIATGSNDDFSFQTTRFDADGNNFTIFETVSGFANDVVLQADGKIIVGGNDSESASYILARYNTDGTLDLSYGTGGIATGPLGTLYGIVIQKDGKIIASGNDINFPANFQIARFTTSGILDNTFGTAGSGVFVGPSGSFFNSVDIVLQADQLSILIGALPDSPFDFQLVRYLNDGSGLDGSFGIGGIVTTPLESGFGISGAIQQDGYLIAAGVDDDNNSITARYLNSPTLTVTQILAPTNGASVTAGSILFSGIAQNPSNVYILANGISIAGTATDPLGTDTWTLSASILIPGVYTIQAVALYEDGNVNLASDTITITVEPPFPPTNVTGIVTCNKFLNIKECILTVTWQPSATPNIASYVISQNGVLLKTISATDPLTYSICTPSPLCSSCCTNAAFQNITITAITSDGISSEVVPVIVTCPTGNCC